MTSGEGRQPEIEPEPAAEPSRASLPDTDPQADLQVNLPADLPADLEPRPEPGLHAGLPEDLPEDLDLGLPGRSTNEVPGVSPPPLPAPSDRPLELRLASIHLRTGVLALARAELETSAGRGELDDAALLDLAEVRWRTDDITGAGEAAAAYFATGREDTLALVIATEATASIGRSTEARRLAARALGRGDLPIDAIFRGIRPSSYWPATSAMTGEPAGTLFGGPRPGSTGGAAGVTGAAVLGRLAAAEEVDPGHPPSTDPGLLPDGGPAGLPAASSEPVDQALSPTLWSDAETLTAGLSAKLSAGLAGSTLPEPANELEAARADLAGNRSPAAAVRLAVVLRIAPDLAPAVLDALTGATGPSIELVRGDALRLSGREAEARQAYAQAAALLSDTPPA